MPKLKPYNNEVPGTLLLVTRKLLQQDKRVLLDIHKETNLPFFWLMQFKAKKSGSSSCNRVQCLYEYLSGKKLPL